MSFLSIPSVLPSIALCSCCLSGLLTRAFLIIFVVGCLVNVPATCWCISGKDLHRQVYVRPTSPGTDPMTPGAWQDGVPILKSLVWLDPETFQRKRESNPGSSALEADALTTRPTRRPLNTDNNKNNNNSNDNNDNDNDDDNNNNNDDDVKWWWW